MNSTMKLRRFLTLSALPIILGIFSIHPSDATNRELPKGLERLCARGFVDTRSAELLLSVQRENWNEKLGKIPVKHLVAMIRSLSLDGIFALNQMISDQPLGEVLQFWNQGEAYRLRHLFLALQDASDWWNYLSQNKTGKASKGPKEYQKPSPYDGQIVPLFGPMPQLRTVHVLGLLIRVLNSQKILNNRTVNLWNSSSAFQTLTPILNDLRLPTSLESETALALQDAPALRAMKRTLLSAYPSLNDAFEN